MSSQFSGALARTALNTIKVPMIESEFEFKQYLKNIRGLVEGTSNSYRIYLGTITKYLNINITSETITNKEVVKTVLSKLKQKGIAHNYWGNCQSALRAYFDFLEYSRITSIIYPNEESEFIEGKCVSIIVNRFERDPKAREACIKHHKAVCKICSLDFTKKYGEIGNGFIHIHHVIPISEIGNEYNVNPIDDLIPVCPNCHAMLHKKKPPYSVKQIKMLLMS